MLCCTRLFCSYFYIISLVIRNCNVIPHITIFYGDHLQKGVHGLVVRAVMTYVWIKYMLKESQHKPMKSSNLRFRNIPYHMKSLGKWHQKKQSCSKTKVRHAKSALGKLLSKYINFLIVQLQYMNVLLCIVLSFWHKFEWGDTYLKSWMAEFFEDFFAVW